MSVYTSTYKSAYNLLACGRSINEDPRVRKNGSFFLLEEYHFSCDYPICRAAFYVTSYDMMYPNGRKLYPEIYYSGWGRCMDGAVFRAHPGPTSTLSDMHQRRIVYQYGYGTPHFKDGRYKYWTDDGFHARNPEESAMDEFVYAWGKLRANRPVRSPKAPFVVVDFDAFLRHGDYFEDECNFDWRDTVWRLSKTDVCNTAEEGVAYAYEQCAKAGYATPVMTRLSDLERVTGDMAEFVILPPIVRGTPRATLESIRRLHARGIGLLASESVVGLEDLFGVRERPTGARKIGFVPGDPPFSHKLAQARYEAAGAKGILFGSERGDAPADCPLVLLHETDSGRTAFVNIPPTTVRRSTVRDWFTWGQYAVSASMAAAMKTAFAHLAPNPAIKSEFGSVMAGETARGDLVLTVCDDGPIYNDTTRRPHSFRLKISRPGVGEAHLESDAPCSVVSRTDDTIVLRTELDHDGASFIRLTPKPPRAEFLEKRVVISDTNAFTCASAPVSTVSEDGSRIFVPYLTSRGGFGECSDIVALADVPVDAPNRAKSHVICSRGDTFCGMTVSNVMLFASYRWKDFVRVTFIVNNEFSGWRDWDPATGRTVAEGRISCKLGKGRPAELLLPTSIERYLQEKGMTGFNVYRERGDRVNCTSKPVWEGASFYGVVTSSCSQPIVYRCDDGETFEFIGVVPALGEYECQLAKLNGRFYALMRGAVRDNFWISDDDCTTFRPIGRLPDGRQRPILTTRHGKLLVCFSEPNVKPCLVRNGRNNVHILSGEGDRLSDYHEVLQAVDPIGIVYYDIVEANGGLYIIWSNSERFPTHVKWGAVQGKDQILFSSLQAEGPASSGERGN